MATNRSTHKREISQIKYLN